MQSSHNLKPSDGLVHASIHGRQVNGVIKPGGECKQEARRKEGSRSRGFSSADEVASIRGADILITGGAGFIGSHLAEALVTLGCRVTVLDDLSTGRIENVSRLVDHPHFRLQIGSVLDRRKLQDTMARAEIVFHLAAAVGVRLVLDQPIRTLESNAAATEAVLKVASETGARVLVASTSEVYGKGEALPFREDGDVVLGPSTTTRWSYAASKLLGEFLALAYHREFALPVIVCRLFNTVGPRQTGRYGMVVPSFVRQALTGGPLTVYGDGGQTRCFLSVGDAVDALVRLSGSPTAVGQVYNVGATEQVTIRALAERVLAIAKDERAESPCGCLSFLERLRIIHVPYEQAYSPGYEDMRDRVPDVSKIERDVGWKPNRSLDQILRELIRQGLRCGSSSTPRPPADVLAVDLDCQPS